MITKQLGDIVTIVKQSNEEDTWHTINSQMMRKKELDKKTSTDLVDSVRDFFSGISPFVKDPKFLKFSELQEKFLHAAITKMKKIDTVTITYENLKEIIILIAQSNFTKQQHQTLLERITEFFDSIIYEENEQIWKLLTILQMKENIIDIYTEIEDIFHQIKTLSFKKHSIFGKLIFEIWYQYLGQKYSEESIFADDQHLFRREFQEDLQTMIKFISEIILLIFNGWFYSFEKRYNIYNKISQELVPDILTNNPNWKKIYGKILKLLGKYKLKMSRDDKNIDFFEISPNLIFQEGQIPFLQTIKAIQHFYAEYSVKKKIQSLFSLCNVFHEEITKYFSRGEARNNIIDVDNKIAIFQYCILKSATNGIAESLDYLEMFFEEDQKFKLNYLARTKVYHLISTMKGSALKLRERDSIHRKWKSQ